MSKFYTKAFFCLLTVIFMNHEIHAQKIPDFFIKEKENYQKLLDTQYVLLPHRGTFLMPYVHNSLPHKEIYGGLDSISKNNADFYKGEEAEFQVSFLFPITRRFLESNFDLNFAYTHHAWWQVYNSDWSRPFRETNYMPEIFFRHIDPGFGKVAGFDFIGADFGYVHQSNGQIQVLSRSWDRLFARAYFQNQGYMMFLSFWYRLPESSGQDDNRDIYDFMGYGDFEIHKSFGLHSLSFKAPLFSKYYSSELRYSYPWKDRLRWFVSFQVGYGHSLIEYNHSVERYGIGIVLDSFTNKTGIQPEITN